MGLPFVGRAGQLLTKILEAIQLRREDVYICNILKCRPPGNRKPLAEEANVCLPYLRKQIALIRPKLTVADRGGEPPRDDTKPLQASRQCPAVRGDTPLSHVPPCRFAPQSVMETADVGRRAGREEDA